MKCEIICINYFACNFVKRRAKIFKIHISKISKKKLTKPSSSALFKFVFQCFAAISFNGSLKEIKMKKV